MLVSLTTHIIAPMRSNLYFYFFFPVCRDFAVLEDHCLAYTLQEQESKCFMFCFSMLTCPHSYIGLEHLYVSRPADMSCFYV